MSVDMLKRFELLKCISVFYSFNGLQLDENVAKLLSEVPRHKLLLETDSPDQTPKTDFSPPCCLSAMTSLTDVCNEPANIVRTCAGVSALLDESFASIANATARNSLLTFTGSPELLI